MCEQVATQSGAVIPPAAPAEKTLEAEFIPCIRSDIFGESIGSHVVHIFFDAGRLTLKLLPVDGSRICICMNGIHPGAIRVIPVSTGFYQRYRSEKSFFDNFFSPFIGFNLSVLMSELKGKFTVSHYFPKGIRFGHSPCHGFFHIYMFTGQDGIHGHCSMPVVRCSYYYSIHIGRGE